MKGEMNIHMKKGPITPRHVMNVRRLPHARQAACKRYVETLIKSDVIVPYLEPKPSCFPAHFVEKGGGKV